MTTQHIEKKRMPCIQSILPLSFVVDNIFLPLEYTEKQRNNLAISEFEPDEVEESFCFPFDATKTSQLVPRITKARKTLIIALYKVQNLM